MNAPPIPFPDDETHWARQTLERHVAILGELAEDGLVIAQTIKAEIVTPAKSSEDLERLTRAWNRAARAVRLSLMLQAKVIGEIDALMRGAVSAADVLAAERKARVQRIVHRVIDQRRPGARELLEPLLVERLDADFCGDILARPISELVELICRDLDIKPHWPSLSREPWALDEIGGDAPGAPLTAFFEAEAAKADAAAMRQPANALSP